MADANGDGWEDDAALGLIPGYWLLKNATGNFGAEDAGAVKGAADDWLGYLKEAQGVAQQAGQQAQAGLDPYAQAGASAVNMQADLAGVNGPEAQQRAISMLEQSPQYQSMVQQSEEAILQNAAATGGLRGGNTQQALAQNRPALLSQLIQQQYAQLGGLAGQGQQAASQQGAFGLNGAGMQADLLNQQGQVQSGSVIGQQQAMNAGRDKAIGYGLQALGAGASLATGLPLGQIGASPQSRGGGLQSFGAF